MGLFREVSWSRYGLTQKKDFTEESEAEGILEKVTFQLGEFKRPPAKSQGRRFREIGEKNGPVRGSERR